MKQLGITVTTWQRWRIRRLQKAGHTAKAQAYIMRLVERQVAR